MDDVRPGLDRLIRRIKTLEERDKVFVKVWAEISTKFAEMEQRIKQLESERPTA